MTGHPYSDTTAGYVLRRAGDRVALRALDGREVTVHLTATTSGQRLRNLGEPYADATTTLHDHLTPGTFVFCYGPVYPEPDGPHLQAGQLVVVTEPGARAGAATWPFERPGWWTEQLRQLAAFYDAAQFGGPGHAIDFGDYRTDLRNSGEKAVRQVQETDTISRMVYGMASTFLLTGDERALAVAERGSQYLHDHMRFVDPEADVVYWYHGTDVTGGRERKLFASEFGDDYRAIPAYEQIYALVGLVQTFRATGDAGILADVEGTVRLFEKYFHDPRLGGYYSHIDPVTFSPHEASLGPNRSRKNWNSVGDHAPAYLFNLYLATGEERYRRMLEHTFDMIVTHLPDRTPGGSPFVNERFHADWTPDHGWGWQRDRAVVGHNLKIAWNLMRMQATLPKREYRALAEEIGRTMPDVGGDRQRGGWYDLVERRADRGRHPFVWHDRKVWWQQEQAILAYLILAGHTRDDDFLRHARESAAFYNSFFLDHDEGGVFFTVLASGLPFLVGDERLKGSHAMAMYHKAELCYLAEVYTRLLVHREPLDLYFRPRPDAAFPDRRLRVSPDVLPRGAVLLDQVTVDGTPYDDFDPTGLTVRLPDSDQPLLVRARVRPTGGD
ncbi:AGE family epimerase/isomerase [Streptomyces sp. DSM 44915]|uniref:AGE family epimerase/isomerase n=1 Tax=Streptomyces chisholmiae TaxID=3075540 RepID=A0ABU2JZ82_9ACTN|nr:AGE family epimerase/isomerase [Streptomyces sp. DSM 44915]MDT0270318.1 AGE family epimerase/isomerase [Streptomyces sp. DSM 44915]